MVKGSDKPAAPPADHLDVSFDALVALLGGAPASAALDGVDGAGEVQAALDAPRAWLSPGVHAPDPGPGVVRQFALEVLSLKLRAFDAACRMLLGTSHEGPLTVAHLGGRLRVHPGALAPARWCLEVVPTAVADAPAGPPLRRGLGMLLARLLLTNDARSAEHAERLAGEVAEQLDAATATTQGPVDETARAVFSRSPAGESAGLLHDAALRARVAGPALPRGLWLDVGALLLRLLADVPGFSLGEAPLMDVCAHLNALGRRLDVAAYGQEARRAELRALIAEQRAELEQNPRPRPD